MDTSKEYIKMCEKAEEIQKSKGNEGYKRKEFIWLPRQDQLQEILENYYHMSYFRRKQAIEEINALYKIDKEKIKEVIKNSIDWSVLFSVWCTHYKSNQDYDTLRKKDLDGFAEHYTEALMDYFNGTWKSYSGGVDVQV